jgi:predicted dehydrogenase
MANQKLNRREFVSAAGLSLGAATLGASCATAPVQYAQAESVPPRAPGEKIRIGFIGTGDRCRQMMPFFIENGGFEIKAICDVKQSSIEQARKIVGDAPDAYEVHNDVLARDDIDVVYIATPDHWHAIITIDACEAGKDVYVEKPLCLCISEGRRMIQAARKHGRIVQMGTQQVSGKIYHQARERIQGGRIGKVTMVRTWNFRNGYPGVGFPPDTDVPPGVNWDRWLGPRPVVPYNPVKASGAFRDFWEYAGGVLTDWGTHHFHSVLDIMGYEAPKTVSAAGGRYIIEDMTTVPDTLSVLFQFDNWTLEYSNRETNGRAPYNSEYGIEFCGHLGTLFINRAGFVIFPESDRTNPEEIVRGETGDDWTPAELDRDHVADFLDAVRTRRMPNSEVELGHKATTISHLGNIAIRTGDQLIWDADTESIPNSREADDLLRREYRKPYLLPTV